ncbi:MAG: hypothetical protein P9M14_13755 [Candidatus Alcyoniella australis]|nr:hypothetical protein [Candidatus Alcyoniella australis]
MFNKSMLLLIAFLAICLLLFIACDVEDDNDDDDDDSQWSGPLEEGRYWLQVGEPQRAREAFKRALNEQPDNSDGHWGVMLSSGLHLWEFISAISTFLVDVDDGYQVEDIDPGRDLIRPIVELLAEGYFSAAGDDIREHSAWLQQNGEPGFQIDGVPVLLMYEQVAELGTEFDVAERTGSLVVGNLFDGLGGVLLSLDLEVNLGIVFALIDVDFGELETLELISLIVDALDRLLNDPGFPTALQIDPDYMERVALARLQLGLGMIEYKQTIEAIRGEVDPQEDDVLGYADLNANGVYDQGEPLVIPGIGELSPEQMDLALALETLLYDLGAALLDRTDLDINSDGDNSFRLSSLNPLLEYFNVPPLLLGLVKIDVAAFFEDLQPDTIRDFLQTLVNVLQPFLPDPPDVF